MKKTISRISVLIILLITNISYAQLELPRISQKASVMQKIGLMDVTINYSRPNVKNRVIWGELVPYNHVWRTGADEATTISVGEDVTLNGKKLSAGKYALFTIPTRNEWTIVINSVSKQWGAFNYDSTKDVVKFNVKPVENRFFESMTIYFSDVTTHSAIINIAWEKIKVSFSIETDTDAKAYANIKNALGEAKNDDWVVYAASASYAVENDLHIDEAMEWIDKSISIKPTFFNNYVKAKLLYKKNNFKEAQNYITKSRELGKNEKEFQTFIPQIEKLENDLKAKK